MSDEPHLPLDACDSCAHRPVEYRCAECGLQLCAAHHDCPECEAEVPASSPQAAVVSVGPTTHEDPRC
jgi:hypothetical protein